MGLLCENFMILASTVFEILAA